MSLPVDRQLVGDAPVDQPLTELELKVLQAADRLLLDSCPQDAGGRGTDKAALDEKTVRHSSHCVSLTTKNCRGMCSDCIVSTDSQS